ncbi:hypothetical protein RvVAR0630_41330 [Agrobacterium vitis]|nr:hypothetical protein RvVAR0630_41330 [Agrobacterium vitis]
MNQHKIETSHALNTNVIVMKYVKVAVIKTSALSSAQTITTPIIERGTTHAYLDL